MGAIMLSTMLAVVAVQASVQLPPQERENRNRLIYARYQVYTAAEILQMLAIIHGYVLRYVTYKQL